MPTLFAPHFIGHLIAHPPTHLALRPQPRVSLNDPLGNRVARQAGNVMNAQLVHDLLPMFLDGLDADAQLGRDLLVGAPLGDQLQYLSLPRSQVICPPSHRLATDKRLPALIPQPFRNRWAEEGVSFVRLPDSFEQIVGRGLLY